MSERKIHINDAYGHCRNVQNGHYGHNGHNVMVNGKSSMAVRGIQFKGTKKLAQWW